MIFNLFLLWGVFFKKLNLIASIIFARDQTKMETRVSKSNCGCEEVYEYYDGQMGPYGGSTYKYKCQHHKDADNFNLESHVINFCQLNDLEIEDFMKLLKTNAVESEITVIREERKKREMEEEQKRLDEIARAVTNERTHGFAQYYYNQTKCNVCGKIYKPNKNDVYSLHPNCRPCYVCDKILIGKNLNEQGCHQECMTPCKKCKRVTSGLPLNDEGCHDKCWNPNPCLVCNESNPRIHLNDQGCHEKCYKRCRVCRKILVGHQLNIYGCHKICMKPCSVCEKVIVNHPLNDKGSHDICSKVMEDEVKK